MESIRLAGVIGFLVGLALGGPIVAMAAIVLGVICGRSIRRR